MSERSAKISSMASAKPARLGQRLRRGRRLGRGTIGPVEPSLDDFVVITGYSGAGKSTAMAVFEDAGYFCVDNLPPEMIGSLAELFMHDGSKVEAAAIVCDAPAGEFFDGVGNVLRDHD